MDGTVLLVMMILFMTAFLRSTLGFGDALTGMPLLTLVVGIKTATPLVAFGSCIIATAMLFQLWHSADFKAAWRLIVASLLGIPFGLIWLREAPEPIVTAILGLMLIAFGLYNLLRPELPMLKWTGYAYLFGFVAGILGGAYNTNGPPAIIYGTLQRWPPERFRATLQGYFLPTGLFIAIGHGLAGLWTAEIILMFLAALPLILLAVFLGSRVHRHISRSQFEHLVYAFLVIMGIGLML